MQRVEDAAPQNEFDRPEFRWRLKELRRMWPDMPVEQAKELAFRWGDPYLLETAEHLYGDGGDKRCPTPLAYEIMR